MTPGTTLLLTFAALTPGLFASLWALGAFLQGFLYSEAAGKLPLRALAGGAILAAFFTFWVYANTRADAADKYGTLFEFNSTKVTEFAEFDAVRKDKQGKEKAVKFKRVGGGRTAGFAEAADPGKPFTLTTSDYVTVALELKEGEKASRFDAELDAKGRYAGGTNKVFRDPAGRAIEFGQTNTPSPINAPSRSAFAGAVALNLLNFVVWFAVFWPVMRFTLGHALGLAAVFGGVTMMILMPLLFDKNRVAKPREPVAQTAEAGRLLWTPGF